MIKKKRKNIEKLIQEGNTFSFENNSKKFSSGGVFSFASADFLAWLSKVESLIYKYYDKNSGPVKMIESVNKRHFNGFYAKDFEAEVVKIQGAIMSCKDLNPSFKNFVTNKIILSVLGTVFLTLIGGAYKFGRDSGYIKFEKEKIELYEQNKVYGDSILILEGKIHVLEKQVTQIITDNKTEEK